MIDRTQIYSAAIVHDALSKMAWERMELHRSYDPNYLIDTHRLLAEHIRHMLKILYSPLEYADLWKRLRAENDVPEES